MLGSVSGRVQCLDLYVPDLERVPILQEVDVVVRVLGPVVLPVRISLVRQVELDAVLLGELPRAGEEVCVDVRLGHRHDTQALLGGDLRVAIDIPFRVDDDRFTASLAADEVGVLGQIRVEDLSEEHVGLLKCD